MNGVTRRDDQKNEKATSMKSPLLVSLAFHIFLVLLFSGAFFAFKRDIPPEDTPMAVDILPVAEKAESTIDAPVAPKQPKKEIEPVKDEPPPMPKATEQATKQAAKPKAEEKKAEPEPVKEPVKEKPKPVEKTAEVAPKKAAPPPPKKTEKKPEKPKEETKKEEPKPEEGDFGSVLKNLVGAEDAPPQPDSVPRDTPRQAPVLTAPAPLGSQMSMSEMDALRSQLAGCWNLLPGARNAQDLVVDIRMVVNPDKTVQSASVVDMGRYNSDGFFRAAADSALRAVRAPECTPLAVPDGKYDQWKEMVISFDPKNMF